VALLTLLCVCLATKPSTEGTTHLPPLLSSVAFIYSSLVLEEHQSNLTQSALTTLRRTFRNHTELISPCLEVLCTKSPQPRSAPLIGVLVAVALRHKTKDGKAIVEGSSQHLLAFYHDQVLASKTKLPPTYYSAFDEYIEHFLTADKLQRSLLPTIERTLIRSPEAVLPALSSLFAHFKDRQCASTLLATKFTATILTLSKSTQPAVRTEAISFFEALATSASSEAVAAAALEFGAVLESGKSVSADQRAILFRILSTVRLPDTAVASKAMAAFEALLPKESAEAVLLAMMDCLAVHLPHVISTSTSLVSVLCKSMQDVKPPIRRIVCAGVGRAMFAWPATKDKHIPQSFVDGLLPALEANLKNAMTNMLNNPIGPLEGYVAVALLYGPFKDHSRALCMYRVSD
jgi:hypothetical protein